MTSIFAAYEYLRFAAAIRDTTTPAPLFILGHWRSGTTLLQNLLACDPQLVTPNFHQALNPHTFIATEHWASELYARLLPPTREIDGVPLSPHTPFEDEFALNILTGGLSPYMAYTWPREVGKFDRYLTMRDASDAERDRWSAALRWYVAKLHFVTGRIPMLKSPPHTARIWLLHKIFPDARFIHVHRHPEEVLKSTWVAEATHGLPQARLQRSPGPTADRLLGRFEELHRSYFQYRDRLPANQLVELPYARLVAEPLRCLGEVYEQLELTGYAAAEPRMRQHLAEQSGYRRNQYPTLSPVYRQRVAEAARLCCEYWGYTIPGTT